MPVLRSAPVVPRRALRAFQSLLFVLSFLLFLLPAAALAAPGAEDAPDVSAAGSGRIVIVPLNLGVRASSEVAPGLEPVWKEILGHFQGRGVPVGALERSSAEALWNEVMAESAAERERGDVYAVYARFARRIAEQVDCETIVFPSLVTRVARVAGRTASWDGVRRFVPLPGKDFDEVSALPEGGIQVSRHGATGELAAASLHVAVLSPEGELRYEGAGGLTLLQSVVEDKNHLLERVARSNAWQDAETLREGVATAFRQPLPAAIAN